MMEWMVDYWFGLAKEAQITANATNLAVVGPNAHKLLYLSKPFISGFRRPAHGFGVSDMAEVLVQEFRDAVHAPLIDPFKKRAYDFDLGGIGGFCAGHRNGTVGGGVL